MPGPILFLTVMWGIIFNFGMYYLVKTNIDYKRKEEKVKEFKKTKTYKIVMFSSFFIPFGTVLICLIGLLYVEFFVEEEE